MKKQKQSQTAPRREAKYVVVFAVVLLAVCALAGYWFWNSDSDKSSASGIVSSVDGVQMARMSVNGLTYEPSTITVKAGEKVRWVIDATNAQGCARTMYSKALGINQMLKSGENVIEFTPTQTGTIQFSCTMGMARGQFKVV